MEANCILKKVKVKISNNSKNIDIARDKDTPIETLNELAKDHYPGVRRSVAHNENTPIETLEELAKDRDFQVQMTAEEALKKRNKKSYIDKVKKKIAIEKSESKKIYEKIKKIPLGEKRDQALLKEVEDRNLNEEDRKELMYDLKHTLNMININLPKIKKFKMDYDDIADLMSDDFKDDLFKVDVSGGYINGDEINLDFDEISVKFDDYYKDVRERGKNKDKMPEKVSEEDKKEISKLINSEITNLEVEEVELEESISEDDTKMVDKDIAFTSLAIVDGKYQSGRIYFKVKDPSYSVNIK
ncbi:hypothetical protein N9948_01040 [bacterium]|nr:hypothetical protein [bacterium]